MVRVWWIDADVGLVDDDGHEAIPHSALHEVAGDGTSDTWVELPGTRWGVRTPELTGRANCEHVEESYPFVQRVLASDESWRALLCRERDLFRLGDVGARLARGEVIDEGTAAALVRRLVTQEVREQIVPGLCDRLPGMLREVGRAGTGRAIGAHMLMEEVERLYLTVAADTAPLPHVDALGAEILADAVVTQRLVSAIADRPELVTKQMGGAPSWDTYERWVGVA